MKHFQLENSSQRKSGRRWIGGAVAVFAAATLVACGGGGGDGAAGEGNLFSTLKAHITATFGSPQPDHPDSFAGITPTFGEGNIPGGDADLICSALLANSGVTSPILGLKVDPPIAVTENDFVGTDISNDGKYLAWKTQNATMLAVIMKGGADHYVYNYVGSDLTSDSWLASPLNNGGNVPEISHYHVCYTPTNGTGLGCTPGYWRNHMDRWVDYSPGQTFGSVFSSASGTLANATLGQVVSSPQTYGAFAFHAVAALLNSTEPDVAPDYAYTTAQVIAMVNSALTTNTKAALNSTKDLLAAANEAGCPLGGTRAYRE